MTVFLPHESIRASAGSGKTYQLVIRYLRLIRAGAPPANILASTFTRLAAGEIRDRILMRLAKAVDDAKERAELARDLDEPKLSPRDVLATLITLARQLHRMNVRTLDSFFAGVVRSFAFELDVSPAAEIIDEPEAAALRADALQLMLDERKPQDLIDLLRLLTQGASDRSVMTAMDKVVSSLFEIYRESGDEPWERVPRLDDQLPPPALADAINAFESCPIPRDKANYIKAFTKDLAQAHNWMWDDFLGSGIAAKIAAGETMFSRSPIPEAVIAAYRPLVKHARAVLVNRVVDQTIATRDLLKQFTAHDEALKHQRQAVTFADVTHAMRRAEELGTMQDIGFRLDATLHHLLLDEFQDTSIQQWRALEPIAHEIVSNAPPQRTFLCVGDVKQSLYGWRNAAPEVLDELPNLLRGPDGSAAIAERSLARSYRSSPVIMDVVNQVFSDLEHNGALDQFGDAALQWMRGFEPHETEKKDLGGYAVLRQVPRTDRNAEDAKEQKIVRFQAAAALVAQLHAAKPGASLAVLTRTNAAGSRMKFELDRLNVPCGVRGGGPLTDAAPINAILDLLTLADHPDDTIAAFHVAASPLGGIVGLTDHSSIGVRRRVAQRVRRDLTDHGYGPTVSRWVQAISPRCNERESRRLLQLMELAGQHDIHASLRTADFIKAVESTDVADSQPAPVQVMTIHQSKGLEFDAVVLPELEGRLTGGKPPAVVIERQGPTGPVSRVCRWMNEKTLALIPGDSGIQEMFAAHRTRTVRESLCVLYVAITRARQGLYMLVDAPALKKDGTPSEANLRTLGGVLRQTLERDPPPANGVLFAHGEPQWQPKQAPTTVSSRHQPVPRSISLAKSLPSRDTVLLRGFAAQAASAHDESLAQELTIADDEARERGTAIHAMFQSIEWLDDFAVNEQELIAIAQPVAPRRGDAWTRTHVRDFTAMLLRPAIRALLTRPSTDVEVHREVPFTRIIEGRLQRGSIDRLVIERPAGQPARATIIDYKTDAIAPAEAAARAEAYREQLYAYRAAAAEIFAIDLNCISLKLFFVDSGTEVVM